MSIKTNKSIRSRIRVTKTRKLITIGKGRGHFNAKKPRSKKLNSSRDRPFKMTNKTKERFITKSM